MLTGLKIRMSEGMTLEIITEVTRKMFTEMIPRIFTLLTQLMTMDVPNQDDKKDVQRGDTTQFKDLTVC